MPSNWTVKKNVVLIRSINNSCKKNLTCIFIRNAHNIYSSTQIINKSRCFVCFPRGNFHYS